MNSMSYKLQPVSFLMRKAIRKYATFKVGDTVSLTRRITKEDIQKFTEVSGDSNPIHMGSDGKKAVVHGAFLNSLVSGLIGTKLPGPGTLLLSQTLNYPNKCFEDDEVTVKVEIRENRKIITVGYFCEVRSEKKVVLNGTATLLLRNKE